MSTLYGREGGGLGGSGADAARKAMSPKSWIRSGSLWFRFEYLPAREAFTPMRTERIKVVALARAKGAPRIAGASAPGNRSRRRAVWRVSGEHTAAWPHAEKSAGQGDRSPFRSTNQICDIKSVKMPTPRRWLRREASNWLWLRCALQDWLGQKAICECCEEDTYFPSSPWPRAQSSPLRLARDAARRGAASARPGLARSAHPGSWSTLEPSWKAWACGKSSTISMVASTAVGCIKRDIFPPSCRESVTR